MMHMLKKLIVAIALISSTTFAAATEITDLLAQAELNNPRAQYQIAQAYKMGDGLVQSSQDALYWLEQAANNRYKLAQRELVDHYLNGKLGKPNHDQAAYWLTRLAISGDDQAQFELGQWYERDTKTVDTLSQAKLWYQIAAEHNPKAEEAFTRVLEEEFNAQRAKQLAAMSQLDDEHQGSLTQNSSPSTTVLSVLVSPLAIIAFVAILALSIGFAWLWRTKNGHRTLYQDQSESAQSHNDELKQQLKLQDKALRKQKQQLELLYNQLKKQQIALQSKPATTTTASKSSHLDLACAMFGYSATQLPDEKQVKQRYKQLCKIYHPDLKGSEEEMKRLNACLKLILNAVNK